MQRAGGDARDPIDSVPGLLESGGRACEGDASHAAAAEHHLRSLHDPAHVAVPTPAPARADVRSAALRRCSTCTRDAAFSLMVSEMS